MTKDSDPRHALAAIQTAREGLVDHMAPSLAYDLLCAGFWALLVAGAGLHTPWSYVALAVAFAGLGGCVQWWRKRHGFSARNLTSSTRGIRAAMVVIMMVLMAASMWSKTAGLGWLPLVTGATAFGAALVVGRLWMRAYRRHLKASLQ